MTKNQIKAFWPAFAAACREKGYADAASKEHYRQLVMLEEANARHLADVSEGTGYERVMARLHSDAGDFRGAVEYGTAPDRRLVAMVEDCARQVLELSGTAATADRDAYIAGILQQSRMNPNAQAAPRPLLDYPEGTLKRLFKILDNRRRALQRHWMVDRCQPTPMGYKYGRTWL